MEITNPPVKIQRKYGEYQAAYYKRTHVERWIRNDREVKRRYDTLKRELIINRNILL